MLKLLRCYWGFDLKSRKVDIRIEQKAEEILFHINWIDDTEINKIREKSIEDLIKEKFPEPKWIIEDKT